MFAEDITVLPVVGLENINDAIERKVEFANWKSMRSRVNGPKTPNVDNPSVWLTAHNTITKRGEKQSLLKLCLIK